MFIVIVNEYSPQENNVIFFIDDKDGHEIFPRISQNNYYYSSIVKVNNDYYISGSYTNIFRRSEGILDKLNPNTGQLEWRTNPKRFPSVDGTGSSYIWNMLYDNGKLILSGVSNVTDDDIANCKPWLVAFNIVTQEKLWEQCYDDPEYNNFGIYSAYSNGIGSYVLELYNYDGSCESLLISTDLMGGMTDKKSEPLPRRRDLNYQLQEFASPGKFNVTIELLADVAVTPPSSLQISKGQTGTFTVNGTYVSYEWYLDGELITSGTTSGFRTFTLNTSDLNRGVYMVTVVVRTFTGVSRSGSYTVRISN
jgi:hypothetical protein